MAPGTVSDALHYTADLARRVNLIAARLEHRTGAEMQEDSATIEEVAVLIRSLDDLLLALTSQGCQEDDVFAMARAIRTAAFLLMVRINPAQAWFWTEEWQAGEREVDAHIATGEVIRFESDEDFLAALDALDAQRA